jgi:phosphotransferase family enzyme
MDAEMLGAKLGAGREADVHVWGAGAVVKLYRPGFGGYRAEAQALAALDGQDVAPKLLDVVDCDGRTGLVVERIGGPDMLALLQRRPWRVMAAGRLLAGTHLAVHRVPAPGELADLREVLAARIGEAGLPRHLRDFAGRVLDGLPDGDRLCHGDYHPGNLLLAGDRIAVIDWGAATRGTAEADHARTLLLLRWADPLPGTPVVSRALIATGRSLLANAYTRTYRRGSPPLRQTTSWLLVHVAARLSEGIPAERDMLISWLERACRNAAGQPGS